MNDKALMQEAWRLGFSMPDGFTIPCNNAKQAATIRFALYNATRTYRAGAKQADEALQLALDNCQVTITERGVLIQRKTATDTAKAIAEALGRQARTVEEYEAEASFARIMGQVATAPEPEAPKELDSAQLKAQGYGARSL
jgi:FixJ family two-component response regulator